MSKDQKYFFDFTPNYCKSCGICSTLCPKQVLVPDTDGHPTFARPDDCIGCKLCELRCPDFAIRISEKSA